MAREKWNLLSNMFEVKTRGSYRKAFVFTERHFAFLKGASANPEIAPIYNEFGPLYLDFKNAYTRWKLAVGTHKGVVQDMNETLLSINKKLKQWEGKIHGEYPEGSEEATAIFPNKRAPFYKGSDIYRMESVGVLAGVLGNYPALAATKADVEAFYNLLKTKVGTRHGHEGIVQQRSHELEAKRKAIMAEMYGNLGRLLYIHRHNLSLVDHYFDMGVIKNKVRRKKKGEEEES
jgi:hypothetical protein